jgi:EpsD family peptidyl-prolyl cis-trans isomerase
MGNLPRAFCRLLTIVGCCGILLAGCGKKEGEPAAVSNSQVVARVGDQVVTTQELENEFRQLNVSNDKRKDPEVVKQVLGGLAVRKYVFNQAMAAKLDREPGVLLDLLRSREQVLENAFLARAVAAKAPSKADVDKYIANNPSKFSNRKILTVEQIVFPFGTGAQSFVDANKDAKSLDEINRRMTAAAIPHARQMSVLNSAEIPSDLYDLMLSKKTDDVFFIRAGANGLFFNVKAEESRPLEGEAAANFARQALKADALKAEAGIAAYAANIEAKYEGEYAKIMQQGARKN